MSIVGMEQALAIIRPIQGNLTERQFVELSYRVSNAIDRARAGNDERVDSMMQATEIPMNDCGLTINVGIDGVWLHFAAESGKSASFQAGYLNDISGALRDWCADREKQAVQLRADNGQFGVGA